MADDQTQETSQAEDGGNEVGAITKFVSDHPIITLGSLAAAYMLYKGPPGFLTAKHNPRKKRRGKKG